MRHPDGDIALFNDAAFDQARRPHELFAYAARFGLAVREPQSGVERLPSSGYVRLERGPWVALFDMAEVGASYIPGHAHADTLSLELSFAGMRLVTNGGTSVYAPGPLREFERATCAHATLEIDGQNSSEVWASFRVGRRARVLEADTHEIDGKLFAAAAHDGYRFLFGRPEHKRGIAMDGERLEISDTVSGRGRHRIAVRFPLHPALTNVDQRANGWLISTPDGFVNIRVAGPGTPSIETGAFAPTFGVRQNRQVLTWRFEGLLPFHLTTTFERAQPSDPYPIAY